MSAADIDKFIVQKQAWIDKSIRKMNERKETAVVISKEQELGLRKLAAQVIPERVAFYADIIGVTPTTVRISGAKTNWGSCGSKNSLNFSWRLMLGDLYMIDYVACHELVHCKIKNHSKQFWEVVEGVMPDYKERRKKLKELQILN